MLENRTGCYKNFSQRALFWLFCHCSWNFGLHGDSAVTGSEEWLDSESEQCAFWHFLYKPCFSLFLLSKPIVKKTDYGLHTQKGCMDCVGILVFCGLQVHIFVCGEWLADGNRESIFYLWFFGIICISFFRICGLFRRHFLIIGNIRNIHLS